MIQPSLSVYPSLSRFQAVKRDPTNAAYRNNLAAALSKIGDFNAAKAACEKVHVVYLVALWRVNMLVERALAVRGCFNVLTTNMAPHHGRDRRLHRCRAGPHVYRRHEQESPINPNHAV